MPVWRSIRQERIRNQDSDETPVRTRRYRLLAIASMVFAKAGGASLAGHPVGRVPEFQPT
jgi:hypothetical protein